MIFKLCWYRGCSKKHCKNPDAHPFYIQVMHKGHKERGPVTNYMHLIDAGATIGCFLTPRTVEECRPIERAIEGLLAAGRPIPPRPTGPTPAPDGSTPTSPSPAPAADDGPTPKTIGDAVKCYTDGHAKNLSDRSIDSILNRFAADLAVHPDTKRPRPLLDLYDASVVRSFLDRVETHDTHGHKRAKPARTARDQYFKYLSAMGNWIRREYGKHSPALKAAEMPFAAKENNFKGIPKLNASEERVRPPKGTMQKLYKAAATLDDGGMMTARLWCGEFAGMRQGKMLAITPREIVDTATGEIGIVARKVTRSKYKKTYTIEVVDPKFAKWLRARRETLTPEQFIFGQLDGTRIEKDTFRRMRDELWEAAGLERWEYRRSTSASGKRQSTCVRVVDSNIHWHDLRHECGSTLGDAGAGQRQIQVHLGQSSWKTSERYTNLDRDHLRARIRDAFAQKKRHAR